MYYQLDLILRPTEGALIRVIGMIERRGFAPRNITGALTPPESNQHWRLQVIVQSTRPIETLRRQMEKMYDCQSTQIIPLSNPPLVQP